MSMNLRLCHTTTAAYTHDIISNVPFVNAINRQYYKHNVLLVLYYIVKVIYNTAALPC